jgi:AcrR family transcriptional regulator
MKERAAARRRDRAESRAPEFRLEDQRKAQLIAALVECIAEDGFERTTIRGVADRAGVSPGLLTYYFKDKKELVREAIASAMGAVANFVDQASLTYGMRRLEFVYRGYLRDGYSGALPLGFWLQVQAAAVSDEAIRQQVYGWVQDGKSKARLSVEAALRDAGDDTADPAIVTRLIYAAMTGLAVELTSTPDLISADEAMDAATLLLRTLLGGKAAGVGDTVSPPESTPEAVGRLLASDLNLTDKQQQSLAKAFSAMYSACLDK